jgi:ribonuclease-3
MLQERMQARALGTPTYRLASMRGAPPEQIFEVEVLVGGEVVARGEGRSKRQAEKEAARAALEKETEKT